MVERPRGAHRRELGGEDVVDVVARCVAQAVELELPQVEVAAEHHRLLGRPSQGRRRRADGFVDGPRGLMSGGVEVARPDPAAEPHGMEPPLLGEPAQTQAAVLGDRRAPDEDRVAAASARSHQVWPARGEGPAHREQLIARGHDESLLRPGRPCELGRPPRRYLLQERQIPIPSCERGGEILHEIAPRGWDRATVVEVPGQHRKAHTRQRTLSRLARHFITGAELDADELRALLDRALELKAAPLSSDALARRAVALIFQKPSTRTRVSFEVGIVELGGHPVVLRTDELQLSRGETVRDTALVLSRHVDAIGIRTGPDELVLELAEHATVPVINMLTVGHHPCQVLADLLTLREAFGRLDGLTLAYVGDGNNVARSLAIVGTTAGVNVRIASPPGFELEPVAGAKLFSDPAEAVAGADAVYTDVWVSMGDAGSAKADSVGSSVGDERASAAGVRGPTDDERRAALAPYRIDDALLDRAAPHAIALHCLPAHLGEEITAEVLYGERERIWDQAENRRHAQKALLELLLRM